MIISFRNLFKFSEKEISFAFDHLVEKKYYRDLKLLKASPSEQPIGHGKMLIITPRASGKAHERNQIRRRIKNIFFQEHCYKVPATWILIVGPKAKSISFEGLKKFLVTTILASPPKDVA